ncbi:MAG: hypothetical protein ACR2PT_17050, partial [Endozoicomonas sp.]
MYYPAWPGLPAQWPDALKDQGTRAMLSLYRQYGRLLLDTLSPRDLQDVLCRISQTLRHHQQGRATPEGEEPMKTDAGLSPESLNQIIFDAFSESLSGRIPSDNRDRFHALEQWYTAHFPCDKSLTENKQRAFQTFLEQLRKDNPGVDLKSAPVVQLVQHYWQFLDQQQDRPRGRRSLLVEGPSGWGKDHILKCVLMLWEQQSQTAAPFVHINASPNQWDTLVETARTAMAKGKKLVISELNLLPSRFLEGLFNDVLTSGTAQSDFALIATVNPGSFGGRESLSTALKSRCTEVQLSALSEADLRGILIRHTKNPTLTDWLLARYQRLSESLRQKKAPVQLSLDDLLRVADTLNHTFPGGWFEAFKTTLGLALLSAKLTMEALEQRLAEAPAPMANGRSEREERLSRQLNSGQPEPLTVRLLAPDADPAWEAGRLTLYLPDTSDEAQLLDMAHSILTFFQQPKAEPFVLGTLRGDITAYHHFEITKFFAGEQFGTDDYRLAVKGLEMRYGQLQEVTLNCGQEVEIIPAPGWPEAKLTLTGMQQLGSGDFLLKKDSWTSLPGLSALDQLRYIQCKPQRPLLIARDKQTGQLLVRQADTARTQSAKIHLDFIIEPDKTCFAPLRESEPIETVDGLLDPQIRARLDEEVFSQKGRIHPAFRELQAIKKISDKASQLKALAEWCLTFSDSHDVPGENLSLLLNLIREKQGVCRQRSQVFQVLGQYFGVSARMVANDAHQYVEISPDNGRHWRKINLGGGGSFSLDELPQQHPENIVRSNETGLTGQAGSYSVELAYKIICRLIEKGQERQEWPELADFLKANFHVNLFTNVGEAFDEKGFKVNAMSLPWLEIVKHWHSQTRTESRPDKRVELQKLISEEARDVLHGFYWRWYEGKIPDSDYCKKLKPFLPLIRQGVAPASALLYVLESLASQKVQEAEQLLEDYYQQLTRSQAWPAALKQVLTKKRPQPFPDLGGHSPTLTRALQRTHIDKQWINVATGASPDLNRITRKQPAFPLSREVSLMRPVFFCLPHGKTSGYIQMNDWSAIPEELILVNDTKGLRGNSYSLSRRLLVHLLPHIMIYKFLML